MRWNRYMLLALIALLTVGLVAVDDAYGRGGRGGGGRGGGRGGRGRGGKGGGPMDRKELIEVTEEEMRTGDRDLRFTTGRKAVFDDILQKRRAEVLSRHRRMGEDTRRAADSRLEVSL